MRIVRKALGHVRVAGRAGIISHVIARRRLRLGCILGRGRGLRFTFVCSIDVTGSPYPGQEHHQHHRQEQTFHLRPRRKMALIWLRLTASPQAYCDGLLAVCDVHHKRQKCQSQLPNRLIVLDLGWSDTELSAFAPEEQGLAAGVNIPVIAVEVWRSGLTPYWRKHSFDFHTSTRNARFTTGSFETKKKDNRGHRLHDALRTL